MKKELEFIKKCEKELENVFENLEDICLINSAKVMKAFKDNRVSENHLNTTSGYGYNDFGRDTIEKVYANIFKSEDALVRSQFISGTHALTVSLFGLLRPGDTMLSITGKPYDTLDEVIGIKNNSSSLKSYNINYLQVDLIDNDFNYKKIEEVVKNNKIKLIEIQRSKGYSTRKSIDIEKLKNVIKFIKEIDNNIIIMVDNCYCEFVSSKEPVEVGADIAVGSLIKNLGAGITPNGAYVVGKKELIFRIAERLTVPGQGKEVGPSLGLNKDILKGLYFAPKVVQNSLKIAILTSIVMEKMGYEVEPKWNEKRADIVQNIIFRNEQKLIKFCKLIQANSPIDSFVSPEPWDMPGYDNKIIMASGSFISGSSIELSCDGPLRYPYIAYMQGGLAYEYGKLALIDIINMMKNDIM